MRYLLSIGIIFQIVLGQQSVESKATCSHAKTAIAMQSRYIVPTEAQDDYDVSFYDINLKFDTVAETVIGAVGVIGKSLVSALTMVELDFYSGMTIETIKNSTGDILNYTHTNNLLKITLKTAVSTGNNFNIIVQYNGKPQSTGFGSFGFDSHNGRPMIWSLSEPYGARDWWPCKDTPTDKADSVDISLEVPTGLIAASNGLLVETEVNDMWTTFHWQERYPIATYLVSIAIHPYTVFYDWYEYGVSDSMRLEYYVFPDNYNAVQHNYALTKDMIGAMANRFGEYPFINEKYGHAEFIWGGGMEHQTLSSLGSHREGLIAHELGHMWWGDMVTCANFHHIWLNEGFATYSEALWYEKQYGVDWLHSDMSNNKYFGNGTIYVEDTTSVGQIFHGGLSYAKASWVLHMLRHVVGDSAFFAGIQEYGDRYRFKSAVTEQFRDVMEEISDKDLDAFFQRWIYGEYYPIYEVIYNQSDNELLVYITQIQVSDIFEMPIDIRLTFADASTADLVIENSQRKELFTLALPDGKTIQNLEIDPDNWILKQVSSITLDTVGIVFPPNKFKLYAVYPNPFNPTTNIKYNVVESGSVLITINDITGRTIWEKSANSQPGVHIMKWNGVDQNGQPAPSGTYIVKAKSGDEVQTTKMVLTK